MPYEHTETNHQKEGEYPKLVRDRIPEIIKKNTGRTAVTQVLQDDLEYQRYLLRKMVEEAEELEGAITFSNQQEELADLFELIDAFLTLKRITRADIEKIQAEKRAERGGFTERIVLLHND